MKATLKETIKSLKRVFHYTHGNRLQFTVGLLMSSSDSMLFNGMFGLLLMVIFAAIEGNTAGAYGKIFLVFGTGMALLVVCCILGGWLFRTAGTRSIARLRQDVMDHALSLPSTWLDERHSGDVLSRMTADMQATEQTMGWNLQFPVKALISGIGGAVMMFVTDWRFALLAIAMGLLSIWVTTRFATPMKRISYVLQAGIGKISECASDLLGAGLLLRIFNLGGWASGRMDMASSEVYRAGMKRTRLQTGQDAVNSLSGWCMFIGLILIGSVAVIYGMTSLSRLMGVIQFNSGMFFMFQVIGGAFTQLQASLAGANRVYEMLDVKREPAAGEKLQPQPGAPAIELTDVCFSYEDGQDVLTGLTQSIRQGETVALVGGSGSGKSTALKLLLGFYPVQSGDISLFGHSMKNHWAALRNSVAYVPQTCYLFSGTVRENIATGRPGATDGEVEEAARAAMAHDFIMELPQGYDTQVGERGAQLSGGQRQRIAIARALLKDAPLLLLDEATASLDSQSEAQVQRALEGLMAGRTVVVVAHRLSTVRNANRILVLEGGRIVEQGSHEELLLEDSRYATYFKAQFEGFEDMIA